VPYYPLYALLFLDTGLSGAQVSLLFAVWSVTGLLTEVPAGVLADRWSRRGVVVLAGVLQAAAFVVWTAAPAPWTFAVGFAVWGVSGALVSGAAEALVYEGLAAAGAADAFTRVHGRMTAAELLVQVPTAGAAAGLYALGGYPLVGWGSVVVCLAAAALALRFPETSPVAGGAADDGSDDGSDEGSDEGSDDGSDEGLRQGVREALRRPGLRLTVLAVALLGGLDAVEEYFPILAGAWGVPTTAVPFAVLATALAGALGGALAGRADRLPDRALPGLLLLAALLFGIAALWARPAALVAAGAAYGLYIAVLVVGEARLQHRIVGPHRATVTSVAGLGVELASLPVFAAWAAGGLPGVALVFAAVVPVVAAGLRRTPALR
jgi:predicted MFS family arabinose efflux permease